MLNRHHKPAVEFTNVTKHYHEKVAVNHINFRIEMGTVTSILGPNGAGKTTTINMMLGLTKQPSGDIRLMGKDPTVPSSRLHIGAMLQTAGAPDTLRVSELIQLWSSYYKQPLSINQIIEVTGLAEINNHLFGTLSGGQKQRVAFALAICGDPAVLFLDEPTSGLDIAARHSLWTQIRQFAEAGKTIIFSTHYLEEADTLADRIIVLNHGQIIADGPPSHIKNQFAYHRIQCQTSLSSNQLREIPGVIRVTDEGRLKQITANEAESVVRFLLNSDQQLSDLEVTNIGLDAAFLMLTQDQEGLG